MNKTDTIQLILQAHRIPLGETVTKKTGSKPYVLLDRLRVFNEDGERREIAAMPGALFLVSEGDANAIRLDLELAWTTTADTLARWLERDGYGDEAEGDPIPATLPELLDTAVDTLDEVMRKLKTSPLWGGDLPERVRDVTNDLYSCRDTLDNLSETMEKT